MEQRLDHKDNRAAVGETAIDYALDVPTKEMAEKLLDELAYQRAVQAYLWGLPAVGMQQWRAANAVAMGGGPDAYKVGYLGGLLKNNIENLSGNPDSSMSIISLIPMTARWCWNAHPACPACSMISGRRLWWTLSRKCRPAANI